MTRASLIAIVVGIHWGLTALAAEPTEPLFRGLPAGVFLRSETVAPPAQAATIGQRLGGRLERLTNAMLQVQGRPIQVNVITAADDASAQAIFRRLSSMKPAGSCLRKGRMIVEYVGRDVDRALATKTSYELGLVPRPERVTYRVVAELATIDRGDDMASNPLFNLFLQRNQSPRADTDRQIDELVRRFAFGTTLTLRSPRLGLQPTSYRLFPSPTSRNDTGTVARYEFPELPKRRGVPYVVATLEVTVDGTGLRPDPTPPARKLTGATPAWPVDDATIRALAGRITAGRASNPAKVEAILAWLVPGTNLKYSGQTGSRWGVTKVLDQQFGHCWDFADVFVTLARASGVPCREVAGWLQGASGHVWAEYYVEGKGWRQVDPTGGGKLECGIYHIPYFTSDDGVMPIVYLAMPKIEAEPAR